MTDFEKKAADSRASLQRVIAELRRGGIIAIRDENRALLVAAAETVDDSPIEDLFTITAHGHVGSGVFLLLAHMRMHALGFEDHAESAWGLLKLAKRIPTKTVKELADPTKGTPGITPSELKPYKLADADVSLEFAVAAADLAKVAGLLPALLVVPLGTKEANQAIAAPFMIDLLAFMAARESDDDLQQVVQAKVPLANAVEARIIAFRPGYGGKEHLAVIIGQPDTDKPVLVRLHSECFTGDLLGSLRCDCGDQLRGAIDAISRNGSGILLYLAQEGRGIGLINKLRAYCLQDVGADTLEANLQLGYGADERVYRPAVAILRQLGVQSVRLLTNNPDKVTALAKCGIDVRERVPHIFPSNDHNAHYLKAKAQRFGHLL